MTNIKFSNKYFKLNGTIKRSSNPKKRWSPRDLISGKIYEWDRGVIGISRDGVVIKRDIDKLVSGHSKETQYIGFITNCPTQKINPFEAAVNVSNQGTIIIQTEGMICFIYFPEYINEIQYNFLIEQLKPRYNFEFNIIKGSELLEDQDLNNTFKYAESLIIQNFDQVSGMLH